MNTQLFNLIIGILLLCLGRKLFWVFVGLMGFLAGMHLASQYLRSESEVLILAVGLAMGVLGALLAIFLQHAAVLLAGFLTGGHLAVTLFNLHQTASGESFWWLFLIGAVLGAILALLLLDWALIVLSSLAGASFISQSLPFDTPVIWVAFVALAIAGVLIQSRITRLSVPAS